MHDLLLMIAAVCYIAGVTILYRSISTASRKSRHAAVILAVTGVVFHVAAQSQHWFGGAPPQVSVLNVLSLCALVVVALLVSSLPLRNPLFDAGLVALPIATLVVIGEIVLSAPQTLLSDVGADLALHIVSSVMSFGVLSIAAVYAVFVALIDHFLRQHHLNRLVQMLPALEVLEALLFRLIGAGFLFLTLSLATGWLFVEDLFEQHLAHKTILSMIAWLVFGLLLWGRHFRGWRGRMAVRMTLAGVVLLLLSYFGTKLVLEVILQRNWQA